jgi:hypothetical protein
MPRSSTLTVQKHCTVPEGSAVKPVVHIFYKNLGAMKVAWSHNSVVTCQVRSYLALPVRCIRTDKHLCVHRREYCDKYIQNMGRHRLRLLYNHEYSHYRLRNTPVHTATCSDIPVHTAICSDIPVHTATCSDIPVHTATCSDIPVHTATCTDIQPHRTTCIAAVQE